MYLGRRIAGEKYIFSMRLQRSEWAKLFDFNDIRQRGCG